jgi:hypothetical protein
MEYIMGKAIRKITIRHIGVLPSSRSNCATFLADRGAAGNAFLIPVSPRVFQWMSRPAKNEIRFRSLGGNRFAKGNARILRNRLRPYTPDASRRNTVGGIAAPTRTGPIVGCPLVDTLSRQERRNKNQGADALVMRWSIFNNHRRRTWNPTAPKN